MMKMNNEVIFAAAGNGKTYSICKEAIHLATKTNKYVLIITYTNEGVRSIEKEYRLQNYGVIDKNVVIKTWYSFLLTELIKPYQRLLKLKYKHYKQEFTFPLGENYIKSIAFYQDETIPRWYNAAHVQFYLNSARDLRKDNVSRLACCCIEHSENKVIERLSEIYSHIFIDELQDYAGWDLEIFLSLFNSDLTVKCVGDHKQATFRTNNSLKHKQYRDDKIKDFFVLQEKNGLCSIFHDNYTRRFNQPICTFVNTLHNDIECATQPSPECSANNDCAENSGVFIIDVCHLEDYCNHYSPTILHYKRDSKIPFNHSCQIFNYGNSKGATFERVVIVPVGTVLPFLTEEKAIKADQTRAKFYVACTRARHSIVFAIPKAKETICFKSTQLTFGDKAIPAYQYLT